MSSINTTLLSKNDTSVLPIIRYLDISSSYRNRTDYPNPNSFIIKSSTNANVSSNNLIVNNLPVYSFPFSKLFGSLGYSPLTISSSGVNNLILDARETTSIDNYYVRHYLEVFSSTLGTYSTVQWATIVDYDSVTRSVTLANNLQTPVNIGDNYVIRNNKPIYLGYVSSIVSGNQIILTNPVSGTSFPNDTSSTYFLRVRKSSNPSIDNLCIQVSIVGVNSIQLSESISLLSVNDSIELVGPGSNNITSLRFASGGAQSVQGGNYELELLWLSVPNQVLNVGTGGTLDTYPYIYCSLYTGNSNTTQQILYSNNPNTSRVLFKVPVNEYFGDTFFITLKDAKSKQTVYFDPSQDLFFELTLPDGTPISFNEDDNMPPYPPNPFVQVNICVAMKRV